MNLGFTLFLAAALASGIPARAQVGDGTPTFEAASVKPAGPVVPEEMGGMRGGPGTDDPIRIAFSRATLSDLLCRAYDVWPDQISGPAWINDRAAYAYRIDATLPPNANAEQYRVMLQNLLADRFHLRIHRETKTIPGYELMVASGGPKLKVWIPPTNAGPANPSLDRNGFLKLPPGATMGVALPRRGVVAPIRMTHRETMAMFCQNLGTDINISNGMPLTGPRPRVIDKTGLTGTYEFTLEFAGSMISPNAMQFTPAGGDPDVTSANNPAGAPDIFTAVEKQLGLKLVKVRDIPVDMVMVDSADKVPTAN